MAVSLGQFLTTFIVTFVAILTFFGFTIYTCYSVIVKRYNIYINDLKCLLEAIQGKIGTVKV